MGFLSWAPTSPWSTWHFQIPAASLPRVTDRKEIWGWGGAGLPYALGSHALLRDKLREGHLLCWLNLHHRVTVTTATTVLPGGCGQKKKGWHKSITGCLLLLVTHVGYPFPLPGPEIEASHGISFCPHPMSTSEFQAALNPGWALSDRRNF